MPIYLGDATVTKMYLGSTLIDGYALGTETGGPLYNDYPIASDVSKWALESSTASSVGPQTDLTRGIAARQGTTGGAFNMRFSLSGLVVDTTYQVSAKLHGDTNFAMYGVIGQDGVNDDDSLNLDVQPGSTYQYTFTCTDSDFYLDVFSLSLAGLAWVYVEYLQIQEV